MVSSSRFAGWGWLPIPGRREWLEICSPSCSLVVLSLFYSIPFGRNLRGVLLGYGLFVGTSVIQLTFVTNSGSRFYSFWHHVNPGSYFVVLGLWVVHLWSYAPNPEPKTAVRLEEEYQRIAATTSRRLRAGRGYLAKVVRP